MRSKIITGLLWMCVGIVLLIFFFDAPWVGLFIVLASVVADHEILKVTGATNKFFIGFTMVAAGLTPLIIEYGASYNFDLWEKITITPAMVLTVYAFILLAIMLKNFKTVKFENVAVALVSSVLVPAMLSSIMLVRDLYKVFGTDVFTKTNCFYFAFSGLVCAWITDTFAYFVGSKFGKHKMSPNISPNKSVEGAVGGIVITAVFNIAVWFVFKLLVGFGLATPLVVPLWVVPIASVVLSVLSMLGDLSASAIKRNFGVKDFGKFMGSHGGIMDRFDSYITVMPAIYIFVYTITKGMLK